MVQIHLGGSSEHSIYVLLTDTGTVLSRMIKTCTDAPYNHASIALDPELKGLFSFGRKRPNNPWVAGFVEEDVYEGTYRRFPGTRCALLRLAVAKKERVAVKASIRRFQKQKHLYRYNFPGLVGVLLGLELAPRNYYFCSQFVSEVLSCLEQPLWERPSALITPNDFLHHPAFEIVYEGLLYKYPLLDRNKVRGVHGAPASAVAL